MNKKQKNNNRENLNLNRKTNNNMVNMMKKIKLIKTKFII